MSQIKNLPPHTTFADLETGINNGGKFVMFRYTISIVVMTFRRSSPIFWISADEGTIGKRWGYSLVNLIFGWWGIPWGPIYTIQSIFTNMNGGKNVTAEVMQSLAAQAYANQNKEIPVNTEFDDMMREGMSS